MKTLVTQIVKALVDHPEQVVIDELKGDQTLIYELRVSKEDFGKVIGKQGHNVSAIRTILNAVSSKAKKRSFLQVIE
ncbi:MAG: KH domain-containing protein [Desulfatiglandaceae bacterium]|jgi:uncharacterized protein